MKPKEAHLRNSVQCLDCGHYFRASKCFPKELVEEYKNADAYGLDIYPGIVCGKCGRKYWKRANTFEGFCDMIHEMDDGVCHPVPPNNVKFKRKRISKRLHNIHIMRLLASQKWSDDD